MLPGNSGPRQRFQRCHGLLPSEPLLSCRTVDKGCWGLQGRGGASPAQDAQSTPRLLGRRLVWMSALGPFSEAEAPISGSLGPAWPGQAGWRLLRDRL